MDAAWYTQRVVNDLRPSVKLCVLWPERQNSKSLLPALRRWVIFIHYHLNYARSFHGNQWVRARARETERRIVLGYKRGQDDRTVTGPPKLLACGNGSGTINSWLESSWNILHASPFAWAAPSLPRRTLSSNGFHRTTTRSYLKVLDEKCT